MVWDFLMLRKLAKHIWKRIRNPTTGEHELFVGPPKFICDISDHIVVTKIDKSEFPVERFRGVLGFHKEEGYYAASHVLVANAPEKVYKQGQYRKNVFYSTLEATLSHEFYIHRPDGYYKIRDYPNYCEQERFQSSKRSKLYLQFIQVAYKYRHKDLQEVRDFVILKELL